MDVNYTEIMAKRTDAELLEILTIKQDDYQPEAIAAAKAELENRNLTVEETESAKQEVENQEKAKIEQANIPLALSGKIFTFFSPGWGILFVARALKAEGYEQKHKDIWRWTLCGFGFYFILIFILFNL